MEEAAAEEATAVVYPPFAAGEALSDAAARLAEHLWQRLTSRRFEHAYQLWSSSCFTARSGGEEEGRQAARAVIARVLGMRSPFPNRARDASYPQTTHSVPSETAAARTLRHDMLRSLAVFGSYGAEVSRAIAASLRPVTDLDPHAEVLFTEAQLQLALNRSGCRDDDDALRRVESAPAADRETAGLAIPLPSTRRAACLAEAATRGAQHRRGDPSSAQGGQLERPRHLLVGRPRGRAAGVVLHP